IPADPATETNVNANETKIDAIKAETALIVADTNELQVSLADGGFTDLLIDAIKAVTDALPNAGALNDLATILADTNELQISLADGGFTDLLIDAIKAETALIVADTNEVQVSLANGGFTDLLIDAIKAETALIVADTNELQVSLADGGFTDLLIDAIKAETALIVADTNELQTDWTDGGRLDNLLDAVGDPWSTALPGAYGAGEAGKIIGDNVNAPIATVDTVVDGIRTVVDAITAAGPTKVEMDAAHGLL
ncbi:unnamed protein product, partial [marine sediment metagenome]